MNKFHTAHCAYCGAWTVVVVNTDNEAACEFCDPQAHAAARAEQAARAAAEDTGLSDLCVFMVSAAQASRRGVCAVPDDSGARNPKRENFFFHPGAPWCTVRAFSAWYKNHAAGHVVTIYDHNHMPMQCFRCRPLAQPCRPLARPRA